MKPEIYKNPSPEKIKELKPEPPTLGDEIINIIIGIIIIAAMIAGLIGAVNIFL